MQIRAIFWDIGGVLLTNAWDHTNAPKPSIISSSTSRNSTLVTKSWSPAFERGKITLDEYLDRTVFYRDRHSLAMYSANTCFRCRAAFQKCLQFAQTLSESGKYFMATINNESRELNYDRIEKFELRKIFRFFVSSCFVGLRKPESGIYRLALETTQIAADECCFIDDRAENLEAPAKLGMHTIQMKGLEPLRDGSGGSWSDSP